jgi:glucoamylase
MPVRPLATAAALAVTVTLVPAVSAVSAVSAGVQRGGVAPGGPGVTTVWPEADKGGFGTARNTASNVWFTLQHGRTSEVFYPDLSTPSIRNLELVVSDGHGFTDRESTDMRHRIVRPDRRSLRFTQVNTDKGGRYRLTKQVVTDPRRDAM